VGLFNRSGGVRVAVAPDVVRPRQAVTATITTDKPLDKVTSVTLEWGYDNFYRYHWAGRADSAAAAANDTLWTAGQVGTNYGGERDTEDWVCVTRVDVPIATGEFISTTSAFTVPSWAPGSSEQIARWSCRLTVERGGRDVDTGGDFTVVIGVDDVDPVEALEAPMERVSGDAETDLEIVLPASVYRAGETVSGHVVLTPRVDLPDGDLAVYWQRHRDSHPMVRQPAQGGALNGRIVQLGKGIPLKAGAALTLPFELPLPDDASPTADAVHSSLSWFVGARLFYAGLHGHSLERVRRSIIVTNA
jgi:hypothetical protein